MGMQFNASQVHDPDEACGIIHYELLSGPARRKRECHCADPRGAIGGRAFLVKRITLGSIDEAFQYDRTILNSPQCPGCNGKIVTDQVKFSQPHLFREIKLVWVCNPDITSIDGQSL
jgi:hypothetical protein